MRYLFPISICRIFNKKIIDNLLINYNFNQKKIDYIINLTSIKYFWFLMILINKSLLLNFNQLNDITCIDNLNLIKNNQNDVKNRFSLVYIFTNLSYSSRLIIRLTINNNQEVPSLTNLFNSANWLEREIYDLFGIIFSNHPDLRRILSDYGFTNHPLLKDFPLTVI